MAFKVRCPACGKQMQLPDGEAGRNIICLACGTKLRAPAAGAELPPPPPPRTPPPIDALEALGSGVKLDEHRVVRRQRKPLTRGQKRLIAGASVGLVLLIGLGMLARGVTRWGRERGQRQELAQLRSEAEALRSQGQLGAAHQRFRDLDRKAIEFGGDSDPDLRAIAEQARVDQRAIFKSLQEQANAAAPTEKADAPAAAAPGPRPGKSSPPPGVSAVAPPGAGKGPAQPPGIASLEPAPEPAIGDEPPDEPGPVARVSPTGPRPPLRPMPEVPRGVTDEQIGASIKRGVDYLLAQFKDNGELAAAATAPDAGYACGLNAICVYALLQAGQATRDPRLELSGALMPAMLESMKRLNPSDGKVTYARGIRATALALANRPEDRAALEADVTYLVRTHRNGAYHYYGDPTGTQTSTWDNSNSQYGLLGVWSGAEVDVEIPPEYWAAIEQHWVKCQSPDGTWGYAGPGGGSASMTAGGTASLFVAEDYLYRATQGLQVGREPFSEPLKRALDWWGQRDQSVSITSGWWGYTLYGIERVGLASGFKHLGSHDWYRELAEQVMKRQAPDGGWGELYDTAYALLFLSRGRHPILMNKLRFDHGGVIGEQKGYWANRSRDANNLARYAGKRLERQLNWQVQGIDRPWQDWLDAPIVSMASHSTPFITDAQADKLRNYIEAGGLLFLQADGEATAEFDAFANHLCERLFPQYPLKDVPGTHVLYDLLYKVNPKPPLKYVSNGVRALVVYSPKDIAQYWQVRDEAKHENIFQLGANLFLYSAGKREFRNRLESPYVSPPETAPPLGTVRVARLKYAGNWDPEPGAWRRFGNWFARQTGTGLQVLEVELKSLQPGQARVAHLTGTGTLRPSNAEVTALKRFVEAGGVVLIDASGASAAFTKSVKEALLARAFPDGSPQTPSTRHPLLRTGPPGMDDLRRPRMRPYAQEKLTGRPSGGLQVMQVGNGHVVITPIDVTSGLLGTQTWGIYGYHPSFAQSVVKNVIFWTLDGQPTR